MRFGGKTPPIIKVTEHDLMNWCISYLSLRGHFVQRINAGKTFVRDNQGKIIRTIQLAETGTPDICGHHGQNGRAIYIEVKVKPNKPTPAQEAFIENATRCGCIAAVVYNQEDMMAVPGI